MSERAGATGDTVLAFDFGERRIGVAVGHSMIGLAHPLETVIVHSEAARDVAIGALLAEWRPGQLVVGLPLALDGSDHLMTKRCRAFAAALGQRHGLPVALVDERLTSHAAQETLRGVAQRKHQRRSKALIDQLAAHIILQNYLDEHRTA